MRGHEQARNSFILACCSNPEIPTKELINYRIREAETAIYKCSLDPYWQARLSNLQDSGYSKKLSLSPCSTDVWIKPCHIQKPVLYKPAAHGGVDSAVLELISLSLVTGKPAHNFLNTMTYGSFESQGPHVP